MYQNNMARSEYGSFHVYVTFIEFLIEYIRMANQELVFDTPGKCVSIHRHDFVLYYRESGGSAGKR